MTRTISLTLTEDFVNVNVRNRESVNRAIGYLSTRAIIHSERYCSVTIYGDKNGCLNATYRNGNGEVTYNLYAQLGEDGSFSYHS